MGEEGVADDGVGDFLEVDGEGVGEAAAIERLSKVDVFLSEVDLVVEEAVGAFEKGAKGIGSVRLDERVGVLALREGDNADFEADIGEFGEAFSDRFVTCGIGVVTENSLVGVALEEAGVVGGESGS